MEQELLVKKLKQKDQKSFEYFFNNYKTSVNGIAFNIVKDEEIAQEITQDIFLKVWNSIDSYDAKKGRLFTWLINITRNASIDKLRSKDYNNRKKNSDIDKFAFSIHDNDFLDKKVDSIGLKEIVNKLKDKCLSIIERIYFKGYTQKEVSKDLGIPIGTVKTRNRNCINELRSMLHE
ncbi:RNA polymerase sigma factor [Pseudofulvibacter geojedonensis]|uniref:RNA polymerase sigma factor n=1 Tax=Pseudofulvibacter geojedonensis TaxID=1123758 RepID=A0ABW3I0J1_9FLAO